ncbi:hypothetical protein BB381_01480 [Campylobacter pinnipediorum subsp. caledonicus]|nr:hypothetical protein BB381_01480 [Campylobacter pinnipediorum subsp. caledonicus]
MDELIKFYLVFDGLKTQKSYYDIFEAIDNEIIKNIDNVSKEFDDLSVEERYALRNFAKNDRKWLKIYKMMPRSLAIKTYENLFNKNILYIEKSREQPITKLYKNQKLKKCDRRYKIQDKIHFSTHFYRFWFRFIEPRLKQLKQGNVDGVLEYIKSHFDEYASLGFELICCDYLRYKFDLKDEVVSSFWNKDLEIDILVNSNKNKIVAEAKYKNKKVCKNVLNILLNKCDRLDLKPNNIVLFSKSGFSTELLNMKNDKLLLIDLDDISEILYE